MKNRLCLKNTLDPPSAKRNSDGILVSDPEQLKTLYLETYVDRLTPNKIAENLKETEELKNDLFSLRMKAASEVKSEDWTLKQLDKVLKSLKNNAARV